MTHAIGKLTINGVTYFSRAYLAELLGVSERTLARWEARRVGPPCVKTENLRLYDEAKVQAWLASNETQPLTSEDFKRGRREMKNPLHLIAKQSE